MEIDTIHAYNNTDEQPYDDRAGQNTNIQWCIFLLIQYTHIHKDVNEHNTNIQ